LGYDCKADVFSAGAICFYLLSGRQAFKGRDHKEILPLNEKCEIKFHKILWDKVSPESKDLVEKLMQRLPEDRLSAKEALKHPWFTKKFSSDSSSEHNLTIEVMPEDLTSNPLLSKTPVMAGRILGNVSPLQ
jgi:serine/threonine protein kinase